MTINVAIRKAGPSTAYKGLFVVTINGVDHDFARPYADADDQALRVRAAIAAMQAEGQDDLTILRKYNALA